MGAALKRRQRSWSISGACASTENRKNRFKLLNYNRIKNNQLQQEFQILHDHHSTQPALSSWNIRKGDSHQLCDYSLRTLRADVGSNRRPLKSSTLTKKTVNCNEECRRQKNSDHYWRLHPQGIVKYRWKHWWIPQRLVSHQLAF